MSAAAPNSLRDTVVTLAGILILLGCARYASEILVPFLLSLFIAIIAANPVTRMRQRGIPDVVSVGIVLVGVLLTLAFLSGLIGKTLAQFNQSLPEYQQRFNELLAAINTVLANRGVDLDTAGIFNALDPAVVMDFANSLIVGFADVLNNAVLIMFTTMFMLFDVLDFPKKLASVQGKTGEKMIQQITLLVKSLNDYVVLKAIVSLGTGLLVWLSLELMGLDFAPLWGVLAFILNFVPTIGSILAAVPAVLLAIVQLGPIPALIVAAAYIAINTIMGNVVEPKLMGQRLGLSTLSVFVSLIFWGWIFGSVGMLLSVPLTMAVKFAAANNQQTRWFAVLLSPAPEDESVQRDDSGSAGEDGASAHEKISTELHQLRLELEELKKGRDAEA